MKNQLYVLDSANNPQAVSWQEYDQWEQSIPENKRSALGKRIAQDDIGSTKVITIFVATSIGHHNRKPQLWLTLAVGDGVWNERRYTSHRAALNGHKDEVAIHRKLILPVA